MVDSSCQGFQGQSSFPEKKILHGQLIYKVRYCAITYQIQKRVGEWERGRICWIDQGRCAGYGS